MPDGVSILGADGRPLPPASRGKLLASSGTPHAAADPASAELAGWFPALSSPDAEMLPWRDRLVARLRDMVRNDGWASGAVTRLVDSAVGADLRPMPRPDFRSLSWWSPAFDATWAAEFASWAKGCWRDWAHDPARWCDLSRQLTMPELFQLAFRSMLVDGDALAVVSWRPERLGPGRGVCATTVGLVDADRLSNPADRLDSDQYRGGVELDADGAAVAYHIREAHPGDYFATRGAFRWRRWVRETSWGRPVVVHYFEHDRIGQHRGVGVLAPVLARLRMLSKYDATELQAAVVNAVFAAFIESPFDSDLVQSSLDTADQGGGLSGYQGMRAEFHADRRLQLNGVRIPTLFPGEKINTVAATRPSSNYAPFQAAFLRNIAAATGQSEMEVSQDWSRTNYSSARAALLTTWKTIRRRRASFAGRFAQLIYAAWLEEAMERERPPLPNGAPWFEDARAAYSRADWRGPGRGWVDPVKEPAGAQLRMEAGLSTLDHECAEASGLDYEEVLDQRQIEIAAFRARSLPLPAWTGQVAAAAMQPAPGAARVEDEE